MMLFFMPISKVFSLLGDFPDAYVFCSYSRVLVVSNISLHAISLALGYFGYYPFCFCLLSLPYVKEGL